MPFLFPRYNNVRRFTSRFEHETTPPSPLASRQPTDHGWKEENGVFLPLCFAGSLMSTMFFETMGLTDFSDKEDNDDDEHNNDSITEGDSEDKMTVSENRI